MVRDFAETLVRRNEVYRGRSVNFRVDEIRLPNGRQAVREYLDHPGAAAVVPFLDARRVVLVRQYRHPVGAHTLELPAGKLDPGESLLACVRRELEEETGYAAGRLTRLISYWPTPAFANEIIHIFVARGLRRGRCAPDEDELIEPVVMPLAKAVGLIRSGKIKDSKTVVGLLAATAWRC